MPRLYIELGVAASLGFLSHWTFFVHGEHDLAAAGIARLYVFLGAIIPISKYLLEEIPVEQAVQESSAVAIAYVVALFGSIVIFRLLLSPLRHIPGPLRLRLTKLTHLWDMARFQNCKLLHELHTKYGDVVRTGTSYTLGASDSKQSIKSMRSMFSSLDNHSTGAGLAR